jgi:Uma2 family endonuclease
MATADAAPPQVTPAAPLDSDGLYEIVNGERRDVPRMGALAGLFATYLAGSLTRFGTENKLGLTGMEILFRLAPHLSRRPDVAFVAYDRLGAAVSLRDDPSPWGAVPNLAVEVISPTNLAEEMEDRILEYLAAGVQLVWVVYPRHRQTYVYESPTRVRVLAESDELEGGTVLPGYNQSIAALFAYVS